MHRLLMAAGLATALALSGTGVALSSSSGPGPNGHNTYGLCTAYSSGSAQGQMEKQTHGAAFVALEATATAWDATEDSSSSNATPNDESPSQDSSETTQQKVAEYCAANGQQP